MEVCNRKVSVAQATSDQEIKVGSLVSRSDLRSFVKHMWKHLSLRARILILLIALVLTTMGGGLVTLWHNEATDSLLTSLIDKNVASYHAAEELENALLQQKGYLTYYFLDGNPAWLKEIERYNRTFEEWLAKARKSAYTEAMREIIGQIDVQYHQYVIARERVIALYREGKREAGAKLHWEIRQQYVEILQSLPAV